MATVATLILTVVTIIAQEWWEPEISIKTTYASKYIVSTGSLLHDGPVLQTDVFALFPSGVYLDLWNSKSLSGNWQNWNDNFGNELDYGIGWLGQVGKLNVDLNLTYFDEPSIFTIGNGTGDIVLSYASFGYPIADIVDVNLKFNNYIVMPDSGFTGGQTINLGVSKTISVWKDLLNINLLTTTVYDTGGFGLDEGFFQSGTVGFSWTVTEKFTIYGPSIDYYLPLTIRDERESDIVFKLGVGYKF